MSARGDGIGGPDAAPPDNASWDALLERGQPLRLDPGQVLVTEGEPADDLYALVSGHLRATARRDDGVLELGYLSPGQLIGEVSLVANTTRTATVVAAEPSEVVRVRRVDAVAWFDAHPRAASAMVAESRRRMDVRMVADAFGHLVGRSDLAEVAERIDWRHLSAGEVLFRQGDPSDEMFLIVAGRLVVDIEQDGEVTRREMNRGETVGELGVLTDTPRSGTVRATRDTTLAGISVGLVRELIVRRPELALELARTAMARSRDDRPRRSGVTIAVVALDDRGRDVAARLATALESMGSTAHLTAASVDSALGRPGISRCETDDVGLPRLSEYLYDVENDVDVVVRAAGPGVDAWTRRVVHDADRVLLVTDAHPTTHTLDQVDEVLSLQPDLDLTDHWLVLRHRRWERRPSGTADLRARFGDRVEEIHHLRDDVGGDTERLARLATGRGVGLVLGGGGARGFAHLGVRRAMHELGLPVDRICGSSIGAPIAAGMAQGVEIGEMVPVTERLFHRLLDYTVPVVALLKGERITGSIRDAFAGWDVEDLWLPFFCVSSDLTESRLRVHRRGDLSTAVRASVAIPGVLPPVPDEGHLLVDGGVLDNLPVGPMADDPSIGEVIAVDVAPTVGPRARTDYGQHVSGFRALGGMLGRGRSELPTATGVMLRSMMLGAVRTRNESVDRADLLLELDLRGVTLLEFGRVAEVAELGYEAAFDQLADYAESRSTTATREDP